MLDALMGARGDVKEKAQEAAQGLNEKVKEKAQGVTEKAQGAAQGLNEKVLNNVVARVRPLLIQDIIKALQTIQNPLPSAAPTEDSQQIGGRRKKRRKTKTKRKKTKRKKTKKRTKKYSRRS